MLGTADRSMAERLEDLNLPNASVLKIIKDVVPDSVNIGKEARTALARAAAVFVLYISTHASQEAQKVNRKTLLGQDVIDALTSLEFDSFVEPLTECLKGNYCDLVYNMHTNYFICRIQECSKTEERKK